MIPISRPTRNSTPSSKRSTRPGLPGTESGDAAGYGYLRASTESVGQPIADNGLWIAACAAANGLPLATLNGGTFEPLTIFGLTLL
jgi:predicted nucleic acid-binding protein